MKKMKKILLFGLMVGVILLPATCFAQEAEVKKLSLQESISIALEKNLGFKMTGYNTNLREVEYEEAQANNLLQTSIVNLKNAEFAFKQAQNNLEKQRRQLIFQVTNAYFQVLRAQRKVEIEKMSVDEAKENLQIVKNKFSLGDANQLDVMEAENRLSSANLSLMQATDNLHASQMEFNNVLGLPLNTSFELTETLSVESLRISLEESVEKALKNRYEIRKAQDDVELTRIKFQLTQNEYTPELEKKKARIQLGNARLDLEQVQQEIRLEINQLFHDVQEKEKKIHIVQKSKEIKEQTYQIAQEQYRAGLISATELLDAQIEFTQAQIEATDAVFDYNLAKREFIKALGEELDYGKEKSSVQEGK